MSDSRTIKRNPWQVQGPPLTRDVKAQAQASIDVKAGEFAVMDNAGQWGAIATDAVLVQGQFLEDVEASDAAGDIINVGRITSTEQVFEGFCSTDESADAAATQAEVGQDFGIHVNSNYHTVNFGEESNVCCVVTDIAANYEPEQNTTSTSPGKCRFRFKQAILDASA